MLKTSTSAKNLLLSVIPWQNVQTMRDHILVNVNLDTLELALSIVQVNITIMFPHTAPITDISIFNNYVARNRKIGRFIVIFSNLFILPLLQSKAFGILSPILNGFVNFLKGDYFTYFFIASV